MKVSSERLARPILVYVAIVLVISSAIWSARYFAPQDGSAHIYNAFLISELLKGDALIGTDLTFNTFIVPNATGHWLLTVLLQLFSPFVALRIMTAGTFAAFIAAIMWLRYSVSGTNGLLMSALVGGALGLNWFWFGGFYNFIIGVIGFVFVVTLYYRWQPKMNASRLALIAAVFLGIYFSHLFSFMVAAGSLAVLALVSEKKDRPKNLLYVSISVCPSVVLALIYRITTAAPEGLHPVWRWWTDNITFFGMIRGLMVDPFIIISRRTVPFSESSSDLFALFMPGLWTIVALVLLGIPLLQRFRNDLVTDRTKLGFAVLVVICIACALFAPDDFQVANGGILRERTLLCGMCMFVTLFDVDSYAFLRRAAQLCLIYVIIFQAAAIWDYGRHTSPVVEEFSIAQSAVDDNDRVASIEVIEDGMRFHSVPEPQLGLLTSIGKSTLVLDNYEVGHYLFPVITKSVEDRQFIRRVSVSHAFVLNGSQKDFEETLALLDDLLVTNHQKFTKIILWGRDPRVENVLYKWFDQEPVLESGRVRVLRPRQ